jgi:hypothetical protein
MKNTFLIILFISLTSLSAQINEGAFDDYIYFVNQNRPQYEGVEGTPYLTEDFVPTIINDKKSSVIYVKFNAYNKSIELRKPDGEIVTLSQSENYRFRLMDGSNKQFESHFYKNDKGKKSKSFFEKVYEGKDYTIFLKENIKYTPKKIATSGYEQNLPAKFTWGKPTYYINDLSSDSKELVKVPTRKKEISKLFRDKSKSIQQSIKQEKFKLDDIEDLVRLYNFYFDQN